MMAQQHSDEERVEFQEIKMDMKTDINGGYSGRLGQAGDDNDDMEAKDDDDEEIHFLVINIGEGHGFAPILGKTLNQIGSAGKTGDVQGVAKGLKNLIRLQSDPYVHVQLTMIQSNNYNHMLSGIDDGTKMGSIRRFYITT